MRSIVAAFFVVMTVLPALPDPVSAEHLTLEAMVVLSRHGIRTPLPMPPLSGMATVPNARAYAAQRWPGFGKLEEGELTKRGYDMSVYMGAYYADYGRQNDLLPQNGCLPAAEVLIHPINIQRTEMTAAGLIAGMLPGCQYTPVIVDPDPLFDPTGAGVCSIDKNRVEPAELGLVGNSWSPAVEAYRDSLEDLQDTLQCCKPKVCTYFGAPANCTLLDLSPGAIVYAATNLSENFVMEYATGLKPSKVGWGRLPSTTNISFVNAIHALDFWASSTNPYLAQHEGSNLLANVLAQLEGAAAGTGPIVTLLVGHDSNLLSVAGLLGASWILDTYQRNQVPPGGNIAFELWRARGTGKLFVAVNFRGQTLDQLRDKTKLSVSAPPATANLTDTVCKSDTAANGLCPYERFREIVSASLLQECVDTGASGHR